MQNNLDFINFFAIFVQVIISFDITNKKGDQVRVALSYYDADVLHSFTFPFMVVGGASSSPVRDAA